MITAAAALARPNDHRLLPGEYQRDRRAITVTLTDHDDGGRVRVSVGDTIEICLPENATAGYRWSADDIDTSLFEVSEVSAEYPKEPIGSGGQACVRITARSPGNSTVRLKYWRPWEGPDGVLRRFSVDVEAVPG